MVLSRLIRHETHILHSQPDTQIMILLSVVGDIDFSERLTHLILKLPGYL